MKKVIGNRQLWIEIIEDLREQARHAKTLKAKVNLARALNDARGYLKYAEKKILALVLLVILFVSGCEAVGGLGRDISWTAEAGQEMLRNGHRVK